MRTVVVHKADKITDHGKAKWFFRTKELPRVELLILLMAGGLHTLPRLWTVGHPIGPNEMEKWLASYWSEWKAPDFLDLPASKGLIPGIIASDEFKRKKDPALPLVWQ